MTRESLERVDRELSSEQEIEKRTESSECVRSSQESSGGEASIVRGREPRMEACVGDLPHVQCTMYMHEPELLESPVLPGPETYW